jgi:pyruvate dehydrogenase E2 component (dihydrolipoamide acetyltransferase)
MTINILMPALSPTMTDGKLAKWLKAEGDEVASGDLIAEIETDKATMEVEAADDGVLGKIVVPEGTEGVPVNEVIAVLLEEGEDASAAEQAASGAPKAQAEAPKAQAKAPKAKAEAPKEEVPNAEKPEPEAAPQPEAAAAAPQKPAPRPTNGGRIPASPLARRLAEDAGIDLAAIAGSGPHGRIVKRDVEAARAGEAPAAKTLEAPPKEAPRAQLPDVIPAEYKEIPHSGMRRIIAARLTASARDIPHFYLTVDCGIDKLLAMRKDLNARAEAADEGYKISVNDFIVRAAALALRKVPEVNASWTDDAIRRFNAIDVCVAVALEGGLITPIVRNADRKGLAAISREVKDLAARAKEGKLSADEYQGGGFTISNLGMYGIKHFTGIINPPQACILAVGAGEERPVVTDGALSSATVMTVTMSCDHRVVDGALGAQFLQAFKTYIEDPLVMLL